MTFASTRTLTSLALALAIPGHALTQAVPRDPITAAEIQAHVDYLASDLLEGRGAGTRGAEIAAAFVASQFQAMGLAKVADDWQMRFDLGGGRPDRAIISIGGKQFDGPNLVRAARCSALGELKGHLVTEGGDVVGNVVLVEGWEGSREARNRASELAQEGAAGVCFLCPETWLGDAQPQARREAGAKAAEGSGGTSLDDLPEEIREQIREKLESMGIDPEALGGSQIRISTGSPGDEPDSMPSMPSGFFGGGSSLEIPVLRVCSPVGEVLRAAAEGGEEPRFEVSAKRKPWSTNVLGVVEGSDPELASEYIVIGGHYDHLGSKGEDRIWNGADDNASGTAAVLEIAEAIASLPERPRRSIVFAAWGAEERGLVGSSAFAGNPPLPLDRIAAYINLDMIARNDPQSIGVLHASEDLLLMAKEAAARVGLETTAQPSFFLQASDTGPFVRRGVPTLSFFSGMHKDYHKPSDDPDTIDATKAAKVARIALDVVLQAANAERRPGFQGRSQGGTTSPEPDAPDTDPEPSIGGEPDLELMTERIEELVGEGRSADEIKKIIKKEFGADVMIQFGGK